MKQQQLQLQQQRCQQRSLLGAMRVERDAPRRCLDELPMLRLSELRCQLPCLATCLLECFPRSLPFAPRIDRVPLCWRTFERRADGRSAAVAPARGRRVCGYRAGSRAGAAEPWVACAEQDARTASSRADTRTRTALHRRQTGRSREAEGKERQRSVLPPDALTTVHPLPSL